MGIATIPNFLLFAIIAMEISRFLVKFIDLLKTGNDREVPVSISEPAFVVMLWGE